MILRRTIDEQLLKFDRNHLFRQKISVVFSQKLDSGQNSKVARLSFYAEYPLYLCNVQSDSCEVDELKDIFYVQLVHVYMLPHVTPLLVVCLFLY